MKKDAVQNFKHELNVFQSEIEYGIQYFYAFLAFNASLSKNPEAYNKVNQTPLFWNTVMEGLQTSYFITLGRIFDQNSAHNVDRLMNMAQKNIEIFSKSSLAERKKADARNADDWIDEYLESVHVPFS